MGSRIQPAAGEDSIGGAKHPSRKLQNLANGFLEVGDENAKHLNSYSFNGRNFPAKDLLTVSWVCGTKEGGAVGSTEQMTIEGSNLQITSDNTEGVFFSWTEEVTYKDIPYKYV